MHSPTVSHLMAAKQVLRYIGGSIDSCLLFHNCVSHFFHLNAFSNFDWAEDHLDCHFTTGFIIFLGSNRVSWGSKKQSVVSCNSTEVEYRALASTAT